jgi:hypothetical protein
MIRHNPIPCLSFPLLQVPLVLDDLFAPAVPLSAPFMFMVLAWGCVLPTREEPVWQRHLVSVFLLGTHGPDHSCDSDEDGAQDGCVGFPVGGLRIPATGGRPDVLGVPGQSEAASLSNWRLFLTGSFLLLPL